MQKSSFTLGALHKGGLRSSVVTVYHNVASGAFGIIAVSWLLGFIYATTVELWIVSAWVLFMTMMATVRVVGRRLYNQGWFLDDTACVRYITASLLLTALGWCFLSLYLLDINDISHQLITIL